MKKSRRMTSSAGAVEVLRSKARDLFVPVPVSIHSALEREAQEGGVSLNQLVEAKLAVPLKTACRAPFAKPHWKSN